MYVLSWLVEAMCATPGNIVESFYYDKSIKQFFSIGFTDYFLLYQFSKSDKNKVETAYSDNTMTQLFAKIQKVEDADTDIIEIPRVSTKERTQFLNRFIDIVSDIDICNRIRSYCSKKSSLYYLAFRMDFDIEIEEKWDDFRFKVILPKVESFLNLYNINPNVATIFEVEGDRSITINLQDEDE